MNPRALLPLVVSALLLPACSREEVEAKAKEVATAASTGLAALERELDELDLAAVGAEVKAKLAAAVRSLSAALGEIKDQATAENAKRALEPALAKLREAKGAVGEKLPSREDLLAQLDELEARFADDETVMKVLGPLIRELRELAQ